MRTVSLEETPVLTGLAGSHGPLWTREQEGIAALGNRTRIEVGPGPGRFERAAAVLKEHFESLDVEDEVRLPGSGPIAFGSFTFDPEAEGSLLVLPESVVGCRDRRAWLTYSGAKRPKQRGGEPSPVDRPQDRVRYAGSTVSELDWLEAVAASLRTIRAGTLDKVVMARDLLIWSKDAFDTSALTRRLAERFPGCFTFVCENLVGATPELLVRRFGDKVESMVLAGSAPRGKTAMEDSDLAARLLASQKDLREHGHAVESVRASLAPLCSELSVDRAPALFRLANVQHLATHVRGTLDEERTALELAGSLHPTAAVCGVPSGTALDFIRAHEGFNRGRYSGPVGWVDARGDGEWGVALRCAELDGNRGRLFAGAGIVEGSVPEEELAETRLKLLAMQSALERSTP